MDNWAGDIRRPHNLDVRLYLHHGGDWGMMGGRRIRRASRRLNPAKEVCIRRLRDGWCIDLPDWQYGGNYHIHVKRRTWEELAALRECIDELTIQGEANNER